MNGGRGGFMKRNLILGLVLATLGGAMAAKAAPVELARTLKDTTTTIALDLNEKTVFCTVQGYSSLQLKVSVPDLDWLAHFNHRVPGESLPCMTAGMCTPELGPKDILAAGRVGLTRVRVVLVQRISLDADAKTCESVLEETVTANLRGHAFSHFRAGENRPIDFDLCQALVNKP